VRVCCVGWHGKSNLGDEAFRPVLEWFFEGCETVFTCDFLPEADVYVLAAGDICKPAYLDLLKGKQYYALGVGLGYESEASLLEAEESFFRNRKDADIAKNLGLNAHYTPDLAFHLTAAVSQKPTRKQLGVILSDCINPNFHTVLDVNKIKEFNYSEYFKWDMAETLMYLSRWYDIVFIPFSSDHHSYDYKMNLDVVNRMNNIENVKILEKPSSAQEAINLLSACDLVLTAKFHGIIFSMIAGTPFINIGVTRKTQKFCEEQNLELLNVPEFSFQKERIIQKVKDVESGYDSIKEILKQNVDQKRNELLEVKKYIQKNWLKI